MIEEEVGARSSIARQLILDIFARGARTREGKMQVELAQLRYLLPGSSAPARRSRGSAAASAPADRAKRSSRRNRRRIRTRIHAISNDIDPCASAARSCASGGTNRRCRPWRSSATPRRQDDAVQPADEGDAERPTLFVTLDPLVRQVRAADRRELLKSDTAGSSIACRTRSWPRSAQRSRRRRRPSDPPHHRRRCAGSPSVDRRRASVLEEVDAADVPLVDVYNSATRSRSTSGGG